MSKRGLKFDPKILEQEAGRVQEPVSEKERAILKMAESLFAEKGYDRTSSAELAKRAHVSERTLFKYFPTKMDILRRIVFPVVLKFILPAQIRKLKAVFSAEHRDLKDLYKNLANDRLEAFEQNGAKFKVLITELMLDTSLRDQFSPLWHNYAWTDLNQTIKSMQQENKIRTDINSKTIARTVIFTILSYSILSKTLHIEGMDDKKEIEGMATILSEGLNPQNK